MRLDTEVSLLVPNGERLGRAVGGQSVFAAATIETEGERLKDQDWAAPLSCVLLRSCEAFRIEIGARIRAAEGNRVVILLRRLRVIAPKVGRSSRAGAVDRPRIAGAGNAKSGCGKTLREETVRRRMRIYCVVL
jgi:hypothetical protein